MLPARRAAPGARMPAGSKASKRCRRIRAPARRADTKTRRPKARGPAQDLPYGERGVLGLARTWPQAAGALPGAGAPFDWQGDRPLGLPMEDLIIYEMHVRGFTAHGAAGVRSPGARPGPGRPPCGMRGRRRGRQPCGRLL